MMIVFPKGTEPREGKVKIKEKDGLSTPQDRIHVSYASCQVGVIGDGESAGRKSNDG
jgi:hypothetical protein